VVVWPSGFLEACGAKAKKQEMLRKRMVFGLAAVFMKMCGCGALVRHASKTSLGQKNTSGSL
jgi:hypothetical protein